MAKSANWIATVRHFYSTTTLHGFKYLNSELFSDRVGWLICCCASACCAGVLCAVLWERFIEVPALITLRDVLGEQELLRLANVAFCPSAGNIANSFQQNFITDDEIRTRLPAALSQALRRKPLSAGHASLLGRALDINNVTLAGALAALTPPCAAQLRACRWLTMTLPCGDVFRREMTQWGLCCVMRPNQIELSSIMASRFTTSRRLHVGMQFSNDHPLYGGCGFFTKYPGEEWVEPTTLTPGNSYFASLTSTSMVDSNVEKLVNDRCVYKDRYTKSSCMIKCAEKLCGCVDPFQIDRDESIGLSACGVGRLNCLRSIKYDNLTCDCLPSCRKVSTILSLESSPMNALEYTYDSVYAGLNASLSIVLNLHVKIAQSKKFVVHPTETWITLLSSLGGVINMFLGVGLFSALEILFLMFVKLPLALRRSPEMATLQ